MIVEYCHFGNLRNYILKHKDEYQDTMNDDYLDPVTQKMREAAEDAENPKPEVKGKPHYVNKAAPDNTANLVGPPLTKKNMISWAFQVARGMEYLASKKVRFAILRTFLYLNQASFQKKCCLGYAPNLIVKIS